jgi:hypothetical protein
VSTNAFAGGSGNCILPIKTTTEHYPTGAAFGFNYVSSRLMDLYDYDENEKDHEVRELAQVYGEVPIGLSDTRNLFLKVGVCDYEIRFKDKDADEKVTVDLKKGIYAGVGMNSLFPLELECAGDLPLSWGYDMQINGFLNDVKGVSRSGSITDESGTLYGIDGQESLYLACTHEWEEILTTFVPYIGVYHSWIVIGAIDEVSYNVNGVSTSHDGVQGNFDVLSFGLLLGVDVEIAKYVNLNVEGRFIGETALTTGATVKF